MKPNFALSLSFEGIALLRQVPGGWIVAGDTSLDVPDLSSSLKTLRKKADSISDDGGKVKLIIPNEQIRYLDIPDDGTRGTVLTDRIKKALDGATPYAVSDLEFDWSVSEGHVQVAAVARETLAEAEVFASGHHFEPVSFVANAPDGQFHGEVFFGAASGWKGRKPQRADTAMRILVAPPVDDVIVDPVDTPPAPDLPDPASGDAVAKAGVTAKPRAKSGRRKATPSPTPPADAEVMNDRAPADPSPVPESVPLPDASLTPPAPGTPQPGADVPRTAAVTADGAPEVPLQADVSPPPVADKPPPFTSRRRTRSEPAKTEAAPALDAGPKTPPRPDIAAQSIPGPSLRTKDVDPKLTAFGSRRAPQVATGTPEPKIAPRLSGATRDGSGSTPGPTPGPNLNPSSGPSLGLGGVSARPLKTPKVDDAPAPQPDSPRIDLSAKEPAPALSQVDTLPEPDAPEPDAVPTTKTTFKLGRRKVNLAAASLPDENDEAPGLPGAGAAAAMAKTAMNFFSRRRAPRPEPEGPKDMAEAISAPHVRANEAPAAKARPHEPPKPVLTTALLAKRKADGALATPAGTPAHLDPVEQERQRMTVFGARSTSGIGGKPRFLGLMLTAALLLFLAGVAAWASVFLDDGLARFFEDREDTATAPQVARLDAEVLDLPNTAEIEGGEDATIELAALETGVSVTSDVAPQPLTVPILPDAQVLSPEEAEATYAATGIWQRAPLEPNLPPVILLDDIYAPSLDREVEELDAIALIAPGEFLTDQPFGSLPNPVPPSVTFDMDERGLVRATTEGALNPEGVLIFAGAPVVVPPLRPEYAALLTEDPEALAERTRLSQIRPKLRPENVKEANERLELSGFSRDELAQIRPRARTVTEKEEAEKDTTATDQAVDRSIKPLARPRNIAAIVERTREEAEKPAPEVTQVAAVTPRIQPKIPTSASVAQNATVKNAINLKRINLIGVYGKPSSRRALVRLANGRYKKVKVGDRLDGGQVAAIADAELRYVKNGRNLVLKLPR